MRRVMDTERMCELSPKFAAMTAEQQEELCDQLHRLALVSVKEAIADQRRKKKKKGGSDE